MPSRSFSDYAAHYGSFDMPALLAEAATLPDEGSVNLLLAYYVRLLEVLASDDLTSDLITRGIRLAITIRGSIERVLRPHPAQLDTYRRGCEATYQRLTSAGRYPEVVRMALPEEWQPGA